MKKVISLSMICLLIFWMTACSVKQALQSTVSFYYPRAEYTYGNVDSIIAQESREAAVHGTDTGEWITLYLLGPTDIALRSPFPERTALISCQQEVDGLHITLSDDFAELTGLELTLACTGLAATCMQITQLDTIHISAQTKMLDGESSITIHADSVAFLDKVSTDRVAETQGD